MKLACLLCEDKDKRQRIGDLADYIENKRDGLYGSRSLRDKVETKMVLVCSTGATEKNIETVIGRRFKKHGMSWTTEGANNLLKLRTCGIIRATGMCSGQDRQAGGGFPPTN